MRLEMQFKPVIQRAQKRQMNFNCRFKRKLIQNDKKMKIDR